MLKKYQIKNLVWLVKDEAGTRFHIEQDDYFGTIATIISLLRQKIKENPAKLAPDFMTTLNNLEKDLVWLQNNYQINPRTKKKNKIPKGKDKSQ